MPKPSGRKPRADRRLDRRVGDRVPKRTFLVYCEGERTEPDYLKALKRDPEIRRVASIQIEPPAAAGGSLPIKLVTAAAKARSGVSVTHGDVDEVWCLFDVEWPQNHPKLDEAVALARRSDVHLAISNPCFELWLVLHLTDHTRPLETRPAEKLRQRLDGSSSKEVEGATYMPIRQDAARRARSLDEMHKDNDTNFPDDNPSSGMYKLLEAIEQDL